MRSLGIHRVVDYWGCSFEILDNEAELRRMFEAGLKASGATVIQIVFHKFSPQGVTGVASIAESHVSIHTWPEHGYAAVDVFSCTESMNIHLLLSHFEKILKPQSKDEQAIERGVLPNLDQKKPVA